MHALKIEGLRYLKLSKKMARFEKNKANVCVCVDSDLMACDMDLINVNYVLLYDARKHLNIYSYRLKYKL